MTNLQAVNESSGNIDVAKMMETWTNQIGYPVVTINTASGEISQKQFLFNDSAESTYVSFTTRITNIYQNHSALYW